LAYLSPDVLERLVIWHVAPSVTVNELAKAASLPWTKQVGRVFGVKKTEFNKARNLAS
jgi:hypothetical protein